MGCVQQTCAIRLNRVEYVVGSRSCWLLIDWRSILNGIDNLSQNEHSERPPISCTQSQAPDSLHSFGFNFFSSTTILEFEKFINFSKIQPQWVFLRLHALHEYFISLIRVQVEHQSCVTFVAFLSVVKIKIAFPHESICIRRSFVQEHVYVQLENRVCGPRQLTGKFLSLKTD